jgi:hypothetical protein
MKNLLTMIPVFSVSALSPLPVLADDPPQSPWKLTLTEQSAPDSTPWTDPAVISYTVNNDGKDSYALSAAVAALYDLNTDSAARFGLTGVIQRNNQTSKRQNNIELGVKFIAEPATLTSYTKITLSTGYARTATYPTDPLPATCGAMPTLPNCVTQYKESIRTIGSIIPFFWEDLTKAGWGYSFAPRIDLFSDNLTDNVFNAKIGAREKGAYTGGLLGLSLLVQPNFIDPRWKLKISGQIRERFHASATRRPGIEKTAKLGSVETLYYLNDDVDKDGKKNPFRVAVSVSYTKGEDPLPGKPKKDTVLFAFKVGAF